MSPIFNSWVFQVNKVVTGGRAPRLLALANFVTIGFSAYYKLIYIYILIPVLVVPHKAVAEVSKIDNYRRGELL